jgi:hypothetical protein
MTRGEWYEERRQARLGRVVSSAVYQSTGTLDRGVTRMLRFRAVLRRNDFEARWAFVWVLRAAGRRKLCPVWPYGELEWAKRGVQ